MTILKKLIFYLISFFLLIDPVKSQDLSTKENKAEVKKIKFPNIVKINTLAIPFNNLSLSYERGIIPRLSAGIGFGYKYAGTEPKIFSVNNSKINADLEKIQGFSITPDLRYYIRTCDPSYLDGFYAGLYFRYTGYTSAANFIYEPDDSGTEYYTSDIRLNEYGLGLQLGYQLILWERFSIDLLFFGPRFSNYHFDYEFNQPPSEEFLDDLSEHMDEVIDRFGFDYNVEVKQEGEFKASSTFSFANTRFGISLGFAF